MTPTTHAPDATSGDASRWIARFERLLSRQIELCEELTRLAERQRSCIDAEDPDSLLGVLSERQVIIERLRETAQEAAPLRERWSGLAVERADAGVVSAVRQSIAELTELMRTIAERDAEDRRRLDRSRDALAGRLAGVARSRGAISAYSKRPSSGPKFQDREG